MAGLLPLNQVETYGDDAVKEERKGYCMSIAIMTRTHMPSDWSGILQTQHLVIGQRESN